MAFAAPVLEESANLGARALRLGNLMGRLTTHVLNTANGRPAAGMLLQLFHIRSDASGDSRQPLAWARTNADGRVDTPLLEGPALIAGCYELEFGVADYFRAQGVVLGEPPFLGHVVLRFGVAAPDENYHIPLLVSPWSYATYRGS